MKNEINNFSKENLSNFLATFIEHNNLDLNEVAKSINCSLPTLERIIAQDTFPTENMIKQVGIMISIGFDKYKKLSNSEKEKISENIGTIGGGLLGFGSITAAISASGIVGLSAAGITSGLAAIGAIVGGGMVAGVISVAFIPILAGAVGYKMVKGIKNLISNKKLSNDKLDDYWEFKII